MSVSILTGDCRDVVSGLAISSFDCIIADPPYGETSLSWDCWPDGWPAAVLPLLKRSGSMWVFGSQRMFWDRRDEFTGWRLVQDIVWEKHNGSGFIADRFKRVHEFALHFVPAGVPWAQTFKCPQFTADATARAVRRKKRPTHTGHIEAASYVSRDGGPRLMRSVQFVRSEHGHAEHPTQKPLGIVDPLVAYACPPRGSVLDPFAGSGTTGVVARQRGLSATLIEVDPKYVTIARARVAGGPLFAEACRSAA